MAVRDSMVKQKILFLSLLILGALLLDGCAGSAPRFRNRNRNSSPSPSPSHQTPRFSSREVEEEIRENDKKPEKKEIDQITNGERDFRKEKNVAIKPLDQSKMMREISKYMGVPYMLGGSSSDGMDCSGYTMTVYKNSMNILLPRSSREQSERGAQVALNELKFGDLIFFNTTGERASHVGIYLGDDLFAHASVSLGITISSLQSTYYNTRYESARRIIED